MRSLIRRLSSEEARSSLRVGVEALFSLRVGLQAFTISVALFFFFLIGFGRNWSNQVIFACVLPVVLARDVRKGRRRRQAAEAAGRVGSGPVGPGDRPAERLGE